MGDKEQELFAYNDAIDEADAVEEDTSEIDDLVENLPQDKGGFMPRRGAPNEMV